MTYSGFLEQLASTAPTPGGGAVAGMIGATAAALGEMVAGYSLGRSGDAAIESSIESIKAEFARARAVFLRLADEDAAAYGALNAAFKTPKSDPGRKEAIRSGAAAAVLPPKAAMATAGDVMRLLEQLLPISNTNLISDLAIAAQMSAGAATAAYWNIRVNTPMLGEPGLGMLEEAEFALAEIERRNRAIETKCIEITG